jgi:septum formation protein
MHTLKIILASSSPYRRELLTRLKLSFEVIIPEVDETPEAGENPQDLVLRLAVLKARTVAAQQPDALVIGSDQVAVYNNMVVGKPNDHEQAVQQLRQASGKQITLYTGLALINSDSGQTQTAVVPYSVHFRRLSNSQIENYLLREQPYQCTGSVKSEGLGIALLDRFEGEDPNALIGLPLIRLVRMLENEGVKIL